MDAQTYLIGCRDASDAVPGAEVLGFKAYNLWRMHKLGLRVPQAFVLGTRYCREYFDRGAANEEQLKPMLARLVRELERASALGFGSARKPLLVSVRSGAAVSMPGMLDTILNIGLCDSTVPGLLRLT
ncbi:MAG TPA: PEP/pyruvate-binding domain-containing protein, partial [Casimicrobiaceae bacterium]|nr:PEP/pyruvate-binding domain-containing protein [Casimicrobiaceae bacterium]